MSSGMNMQEAEKVAEKMSYRQAVINCLYARCVPYRKATKIKMEQLLEIAEKQKEHDAKIKTVVADEIWVKVIEIYDSDYSSCVNDYMDYKISLRDIDEILEKMKEQSNE